MNKARELLDIILNVVHSPGANEKLRLDAIQDAFNDIAAQAKSGREIEWNPRHTAPRDGTAILVCSADYLVEKSYTYPRTVMYNRMVEGWKDRSGHRDATWTHWIGLPQAPVTKL